MYLLLLLLLNLYSVNAGVNDAILYGRRGAESFKWNEHLVFVLERLLFILAIAAATQVSVLSALLASVSFALTYSFLHNQSYYYSRNLIDNTPFDWKYTSTSSTAKFTLTYKQRLIMFIAGIAAATAHHFI